MKRGRGSEIDRICIGSHIYGGLTNLLDVSQSNTSSKSVKNKSLSPVAIKVSVLILFPIHIFILHNTSL